MLRQLLTRVGVVPVITIHDPARAAPLAEALCAGGLTVLEVTLRSPAALEAITAMRRAVPDALVGAGTVVTVEQLSAAVAAGSQFLVSPGFSSALGSAARASGVPLLPGIATPTELIAALDAGFETVKFFPAEQVGGVPMLKALHAPFPGVMFCPTGGISAQKAPEYLAQPNVVAVGMSSVAPPELIARGDFEAIAALARAASALRSRTA
jgi:2-dehydro-3-deoxyphosphogluconate aldolase/(4S)-4-hydroxy-2-oxoglutarate aldolase